MGLTLALSLLLTQPQLPHRWVYLMTNLQVAANADSACELVRRAKKAGYNGLVLADSKLQRLDSVPDFYFANAKKLIAAAAQEGVEIIPSVWPVGYASAMLGHDVNLVEALPIVDAPFVVLGGEARPAAGTQNLLATGDLEQGSGDKFAGLNYQDGPGQSTFLEKEDAPNGRICVRMEQFTRGNEAGNARLVWYLKTQPFHQYVLSGWYRREGLKGLAQAIVLDAKGRNLAVTEIDGRPTHAWEQFRFSFNSLEASEVKIYVGVWGGSAGKMWWDGIHVSDAGLMNLVRRPGCPFSIKTADGERLQEGVDYEKVSDPGLGQKPWPGEYDVDHAGPAIRMIKGRSTEGTALLVSGYHAKTGIGGQASICLSEPKTLALMEDEARRVVELFHPKALFWSHDEIRIGGWCAACQGRGKTPGQILADNVRFCSQIQQKLLPNSQAYVWSDMFDPNHNAHDGYYLTRGTLAGSWEGLPKEVTIVNWHFGARDKSLPFFSQRGHRQILAGYYDGPVDSIRTWLDSARGIKGVEGAMYTTWVGDYSQLEQFARAAWGQK